MNLIVYIINFYNIHTMTALIFLMFALTSAAPVVYPINKDVSDRVVCSSWMMKTEQNVMLKTGKLVFKPNVEYSTSSLVGQKDKFLIINTDEKFYMDDFYNMMNYDSNKFIIWSIDGSIKFYNCIKQDEINPKFNLKFTNETFTTIVEKNSIDVRGCLNNIDCININCKNMVYVKETLSCYPKTENGNVLGYYINSNKDW